MKWLDDEVFAQDDDERDTIDEEQRTFEEELDQAFVEASKNNQRQREVAVRCVRGISSEGDEP